MGYHWACWEHKRERCHLCGQSCTTYSWLVALSNCAKESFLSESSNKWRPDSNNVIRAWSSFLRPQRKAQRLWTSGRPWKAWAGGQSPSLNHAHWFQKKYWSFCLVRLREQAACVQTNHPPNSGTVRLRNCSNGRVPQLHKWSLCAICEEEQLFCCGSGPFRRWICVNNSTHYMIED